MAMYERSEQLQRACEGGSVTALFRRVRTLEASVYAPMWVNTFVEAQNLALSRMALPEREVLKAVIAHGPGAQSIDYNGDLWHRWEAVFAEAVIETRCPVALTALDMML